MKIKLITLLAAGLVLAAIALTAAEDRKSRATKEFMRDKLELSQKILEGLALEDFALIGAKSQKLSAMSQAAGWQVFDNPDYTEQSADFRKQVEALTRAAERKNIDGATLAYVRMTMSCVDCHKLVRGKLLAAHESLDRMPSPARAKSGSVATSSIGKGNLSKPQLSKPLNTPS